jgi:hypothetical protein
MSDSAHVSSLEAVARFTASLRQFDDEARSVLLALDQQIERALYWLDFEQPAYWRQQIRKQYDEVARTRTAWENCMLRTVAGDRPTCLEEEQAHRAAKKKLEVALGKPDQIRRWAIKVHQDIDEYRGRIGRLRHALEGSVPRTIGLLERTQASLERYVEHQGGTDLPTSV